MKATLSLAQELRAIRNGPKPVVRVNNLSDVEEPERPWQADIDRMQQTLQDVLQAFSQFSGVELPGVGPDSEGIADSLPQLNFKTLKDRIRNELEAFSVTTASELAKQAEEQTRAALGVIKNEVSGQVDQIAGEFREKLQSGLEPAQIDVDISKQSRDRVAELVQAQTDEFARWVWLTCKGTGTPIPAQIEKLLAPYVEEASSKFEEVVRQKAQGMLAEQEQLIQERLQGTTSSLESQINGLQQAALQICEENADSVTKQSAERLNATADAALKDFEGKVGNEAEGAVGRFQQRLEELANVSREGLRREGDLQAENLKHRLEGLAGDVQEKSVSEIATRIEQTAANVVESSVQHLYQQAHDASEHAEEELKAFTQLQMDEVRGKVKEISVSAIESLSRDAANVEVNVKALDKELAAVEQKHLANSEQQLCTMIQATMESLTGRLKQIANVQLEEIGKFTQESQDNAVSRFESRLHEAAEGQYTRLLEQIQKDAGEAAVKAAAEVRANSESMVQEISSRVNASASVLQKEGVQASTRIESMLNDSLEKYRQQLTQLTEAGLEGHRKVIEGSITGLQSRLKQAAELLGSADTKI